MRPFSLPGRLALPLGVRGAWKLYLHCGERWWVWVLCSQLLDSRAVSAEFVQFGGAGTFSRGLNPSLPPLRVHYRRQCSSVVIELRCLSAVWSACRCFLPEGFCFLSVVSSRLLSSVSGTRGVYHSLIIVISVRNPSSDHAYCHQCPEPEF